MSAERLPVADVLGLAAGGISGVASAGFDIVTKKARPDGFGVKVALENRKHLPGPWEPQCSDAVDWEPVTCAMVAGIPPCTGFSVTNVSKGATSRGVDSTINDCMWEVVRYAASCKGDDGQLGPDVVMFESVQQAGRQGRLLMQRLRDLLEARTGQRYTLTHLFLSGSSVGAAQRRPRYFFTAHRVPFGIEVPSPRAEVTYAEAIGDLQGMMDTWDEQPYVNKAVTPFQSSHRRGAGAVTAHVWPKGSWRNKLNEVMPGWPAGRDLHGIVNERHTAGVPHGWISRDDGSPKLGLMSPAYRIKADGYGRVLTGSAGSSFIHWAENRCLTVRECARLMGLPDDWTFDAANGSVNKAYSWLGKNVCRESYQFAAHWAREAILGTPGSRSGQDIGDREMLIDITHAWKGKRIIA